MEIVRENKAVRLDENPMGNEEEVKVDDGGDERDENEISHMDKLPNEILMKILCYLDEKQLVKCRILSSRWNEICCIFLQDESNTEVGLQKRRGQNGLECETEMERNVFKKGSFDEFLNCFTMTEAEKSSGRPRPFPFCSFYISGLNYMTKDQMTQFVSLFVHIKYLTLNIKRPDLKNFGTFWRLLLKFAPNIVRLKMFGDQWCKVDLFEPYYFVKTKSDLFKNQNVSDKTRIQDDSFLNKLKILDIEPLYCDGILYPMDFFLEYTPNVQELLHHDEFYILTVRQKQNRAHLLKNLKINGDPEIDLLPAEELMKNLQLEYLEGACEMSTDSNELERATINYVAHALKSSQGTLSHLYLYYLTSESVNFLFKDIKSLPNVRRLHLDFRDSMEIGNLLERFRKLCPNITSLELGTCYGFGPDPDFLHVPPILWTQFQGLKSLKFHCNMRNKSNTLLAVDSVLSGYSQESIQNIQAKLEEGIFLEEARREEQQTSSILDLKNLSHLELEFFMGERSEETEKLENQIRNFVFMKILPQHIREYPRSISYVYA